MFLKNSEITKMILKIMKTNLKIVKQIKTKYFSNANVKKVGICRTFQNYFKHTEKPQKMPKLRNKNKDRDGAYSNFKNIGRFKKTLMGCQLAVIAFGMAYVFFGIQDAYLRTLQQS